MRNYKKENEKLKNEISTLKWNNEQLKRDIKILETENTSIREGNSKLIKEKYEVIEKYELLKSGIIKVISRLGG